MADTIKTVVTQREEAGIDSTQTVSAKTPTGDPNLTVIPMPWWQQVGVRVLRVYLQGLAGFITLGATGQLPLGEFGGVLLGAAKLAVAPAAVTLLMNATEILTKLDSTSYARFRA